LGVGEVLGTGNFAIAIREVWASAVEQPVISEDSDRPAAVRLVVEDSEGRQGETIVEQYAEGQTVRVGDRELTVSYGPEIISLPYRLHLDDFLLITYPGSNNPASFESHVRLFDDERGVQGDPARIYMNHPFTYRGFKHFQSSYDRDRLGTILSVSHDPGKLPTYLGYILVGIGFLVTLTRGIWYRRPVA
jgi:cytochrome c biogenesis protein ResB